MVRVGHLIPEENSAGEKIISLYSSGFLAEISVIKDSLARETNTSLLTLCLMYMWERPRENE